jgi:hypothetical protein
MTEANSPMFALGCEDGAADTARISACPSQAAIGPRPPNPAYPVMYERGYRQEFHPEMAHRGCQNCKEN